MDNGSLKQMYINHCKDYQVPANQRKSQAQLSLHLMKYLGTISKVKKVGGKCHRGHLFNSLNECKAHWAQYWESTQGGCPSALVLDPEDDEVTHADMG